MAITPRTILSEPVNLVVFSLGAVALIALVALAADSRQSQIPCTLGSVRTAPAEYAPSAMRHAPARADSRTYTKVYRHSPCQLVTPRASWSSAQWVRHLDCMEARETPTDLLLSVADTGIEAVGLSPNLALKKSDYLRILGTLDEQIAFLETAVQGLGVVDGELVHRLSRALIWRGRQADLERIRQLQHLSRMLLSDNPGRQCEVRQTDIWARYMMAKSAESADGTIPSAALNGVNRAVRAYVDAGCHNQIHHGKWNDLAEVVGVAIAAEASNGHDAHSSLIRLAAHAYQIKKVPALCRTAVPGVVELRFECEKRVGDELFLAK